MKYSIGLLIFSLLILSSCKKDLKECEVGNEGSLKIANSHPFTGQVFIDGVQKGSVASGDVLIIEDIDAGGYVLVRLNFPTYYSTANMLITACQEAYLDASP